MTEGAYASDDAGRVEVIGLLEQSSIIDSVKRRDKELPTDTKRVSLEAQWQWQSYRFFWSCIHGRVWENDRANIVEYVMHILISKSVRCRSSARVSSWGNRPFSCSVNKSTNKYVCVWHLNYCLMKKIWPGRTQLKTQHGIFAYWSIWSELSEVQTRRWAGYFRKQVTWRKRRLSAAYPDNWWTSFYSTVSEYDSIRPRPLDHTIERMQTSSRARHESSLRSRTCNSSRGKQYPACQGARHCLRWYTRPVLGPARTVKEGWWNAHNQLYLYGK